MQEVDHSQALNQLAILQELGTQSIYLIGFSFILGSCFTVLVLLILDLVRSRSEKQEKSKD